MRAAIFNGPRSIEVGERPDAVGQAPTDAVVRVEWDASSAQTSGTTASSRPTTLDVTFVHADADVHDDVDAPFRAKYRGSAGRILDSAPTAEARSTTLKLAPH